MPLQTRINAKDLTLKMSRLNNWLNEDAVLIMVVFVVAVLVR